MTFSRVFLCSPSNTSRDQHKSRIITGPRGGSFHSRYGTHPARQVDNPLFFPGPEKREESIDRANRTVDVDVQSVIERLEVGAESGGSGVPSTT
jgi:hypothetical protein